MKKIVIASLLAFALGAGLVYVVLNRTDGDNAAPGGEQLWTCGMHPQVVQDEPGQCPICGMNLVPLEESPDSGSPAQQLWTCPMHPDVIETEPGNCPICNMKLVPVEPSAGAGDHEGHVEGDAGGKPAVRVSPAFLQNFAVRTVAAERGSIPLEIRTVGSLRFNEKSIVSVNTKYAGWIERAEVNYVGEAVAKGQLLFEVYSPELVTAQKEYLAALEYVESLSATAEADAVARARSLLAAAAERLEWWDVSTGQIENLKQRKTVARTLPVYAPASGVVMEKMGDSLEGMRLTPGMTVFQIADVGTIWADVEIYEHQMRHVRLGQQAHVTTDAFPGRHWMGKVVYLDPVISPQTRTLKASVEIDNGDGRLRPQLFVNVEMRQPAATGVVTVPEEVVLHTGTRSLVVVQREPGLFEPRAVELGASGNGRQEVRQGLKAGEVVVASSQFLIDSESSLREAIDKMLAGSGSNAPPAPMAEHQH